MLSDNELDSIAFNVALEFQLNPFNSFNIKFEENDLNSLIDMSELTYRLLISLEKYCKKVEIKNKKSGIWNISFYNNKKQISLLIIDENNQIYESKKYIFKNNYEFKKDLLEKLTFKENTLERLKDYNLSCLFNEYKIIYKNKPPIFELNEFSNLFKKLFKVNINSLSQNTIEIEPSGDMLITIKDSKVEIPQLFSFNKKIKIKFFTINNRIVLHYFFNGDIKDNNLLNRKVLSNNESDFLLKISKNQIYNIDYTEEPIAYINDNVQSEKIWKLSIINFDVKTVNNNITDKISCFSIQDFYRTNNNYKSGNINIIFKNYLYTDNITFSKAIEMTDNELKSYLFNKITGIHILVKELIQEIIIDSLLMNKEKYVSL